MSTGDLHVQPPETRPFSKSYRRFLVFRWILVYFYAPLMVVGALWPCPDKYPWILPLVAAVVAVIFLVLWKSGGDVGAMMILVGAVAGLATWTLSHYLKPGLIAGSLMFVGSVLPGVVFVIYLAAMAGSADDPRFDDEY